MQGTQRFLLILQSVAGCLDNRLPHAIGDVDLRAFVHDVHEHQALGQSCRNPSCAG
jgi:hypothetical protein